MSAAIDGGMPCRPVSALIRSTLGELVPLDEVHMQGMARALPSKVATSGDFQAARISAAAIFACKDPSAGDAAPERTPGGQPGTTVEGGLVTDAERRLQVPAPRQGLPQVAELAPIDASRRRCGGKLLADGNPIITSPAELLLAWRDAELRRRSVDPAGNDADNGGLLPIAGCAPDDDEEPLLGLLRVGGVSACGYQVAPLRNKSRTPHSSSVSALALPSGIGAANPSARVAVGDWSGKSERSAGCRAMGLDIGVGAKHDKA
jgi:hypothetical protein